MITTRRVLSQGKAARATSDASAAHQRTAIRCSEDPPGTSNAVVGAGKVIARIAPKVPIPALKAAATSSIESVQQAHRIANAGELRSHTLWHRRRGADAVPASIVAKANELLHHRATVVEASDAAYRQQPAASRSPRRVPSPDQSRVKDEVD